jgi:hypothetical protein
MGQNQAYSDRIFPVTLFAVTIVLAVGGGAFYWYHTSKGSEFERVYSQLGIQPLPSSVERQQQVQSRLAQLNREPCYKDAVIGLGRALRDAGYPREAATSLHNFVGAAVVLPKFCRLPTEDLGESMTFPPPSRWQTN